MLEALLITTLCLTATALPASPEIPNIPGPPAVPDIPDSPHIPHSHDPSAVPESQGIFINLNNGELCILSSQCKSSCCQHSSGLDLFRCAPRAAERETCSKYTLYDTYYFCPCENGLKCEGDWSIGGSITNTNFGNCVDPNSPV
ncbi:colipase-like [Colossoma macropomum]|uniref:colipase-like n=1 Tax=Colossoma macropomum TaxID=42526 RepID=UPI00186465FC|nr:colipase-like [Colossoma macropomum]